MEVLKYVAVLILFAAVAAGLLWYLRARVRMANNPKLIEAGTGAVKGGVFLRIYRRCRSARGLGEQEATHLAAAAISSLYGETPEDPNAVVCLQDRPDEVEAELRELASEDERVRCLLTDALTFRTRLPARPPYDRDAAWAALDRARELGVAIPDRRSAALWAFARQAVQFLKEENRRTQGV
jgi:hypothetical protein